MAGIYRVEAEPVARRMHALLGDDWRSILSAKLNEDRSNIRKALSRAEKAGGLSLAMVEKWCDAIRVHPCFVVHRYHWHVEQDQQDENKIKAREAQERFRAKRRAQREAQQA